MIRTKVSYVWEQRVTDYKASGQATQTWCKSNDIRPATLRYWIRVFKDIHADNEKVTNWVSVSTTELEMTNKVQTLIIKIGNASIEINSDFDKELFLKVTEVLISLC